MSGVQYSNFLLTQQTSAHSYLNLNVVMGISLFQTDYLLIPVINNAQNTAGNTADALSIVIITRGATVALPT